MSKNALIIIGLILAVFAGLVVLTKGNEEVTTAEPSQHVFGEGGKKGNAD